MKNKILSLVLALLMAASSASAVLADDVVAIDETAEEVAVVEEVEAGQYDKAIEFLANYGIFKGYDKNNTGAEDPIERYQMALFVARIATGWTEDEVWEDGPENWSEFSDIDFAPVNNYYGALSFANQKGIIEGYGNGKFGPQDHITYQNALTMVVRTLGYTGLDWPWGYIQKAVELGLTDGITGVAYTDELTRGEVAQIVYNALFAKMKDGSNLALKNFGIEFGWEKVVITASNINTFTKLAEDKGTNVEKQFVEFKLLNDDGSLADDTYKALAADFKLDYEAHEDDLAVGKAYYVLFEKDANSELAEIVAIEDLSVGTINNEGKTDDEGEDQAYAIKKFFEDYSLVTKYTANNYLNTTASLKDEVLVWDKTADIKVMEDAGHFIAIDWETGNILVPIEIKDNKVVDTDKDEVTENDFDGDWKVAWYRWESETGHNERYYEKQYGKDGELKGINWMSEEEFEKTYANTLYKKENKYNGFAALASYSNTAYASLDLFDTNLDGVADRGLYESYKLGYFSNTTEKCGKCDKEYATWTLSAVGTEEKSVGASASKTELWIEGTCDHKGHAWFVEGYTPVVDEDGEYEDGYVIYNYDDETGAIKVVKNIDDGSDADSYVATGVLRAYNTAKETITIGEDKLDMNYDDLAGTGFYKVNDSLANKTLYSAILNKYFNQFVTYVVVDGELVHVELAGAKSTDELLVVDSYAGISNDGFVVINGYSTDDLKYEQFRLGSIDGWKKGDAFYYADEYEDGFGKGDVYKVVSYDEEADVYYVELITETEYSVDRDWRWLNVVNGYESEHVLFMNDANIKDSYMAIYDYDAEEESNWEEKPEYVKMSDSDKYVFVMSNEGNVHVVDERYAVVRVFNGKLPEGSFVYGDLVKAKDGTYVFVNAVLSAELQRVLPAYGAGMVVLYEDSRFYAADYNGENAEDWYLLGAVEYEVSAFNLLTAADDVTVYATNKDYENGFAYYTQDGVLADGAKYFYGNAAGIVGAIQNAFSKETYWADTIAFNKLANIYNTTKNDDGIEKNRVAVEAELLADGLEIDGTTRALNKLDKITYKVIEIEQTTNRFNGVVTNYIADINSDVVADADAEEFLEFVEDGNYTDIKAFYVYDVAGKDVVIYLVLNDAENTVTTSAPATIKTEGKTGYDTKETAPIVVGSSTKVDLDIVAEVTVEKEFNNGNFNGKVTLKEMTFGTAGDYLKTWTDHLDPASPYHYGKVTVDADGNKEWNNVFADADCAAADATAEAIVTVTDAEGKLLYQDYAVVTYVSVYDDNCGLVNKIKVALADEVVFTKEATVEVDLDLVDGLEDEHYEFVVDVADAWDNYYYEGSVKDLADAVFVFANIAE